MTRARGLSGRSACSTRARSGIETALLAGEIAEDDLIEAKVFSNRAHLGRFRRGAGFAGDKIGFLDARGATNA